MQCSHCASDILEDCHYCPVCGKPTPLSAEVSAARLVARPESESIAPFTSDTASSSPLSASSVPEQEVALPATLTTAPAPPDTKAIHTLLAQANLYRLRRQWSEATEQCVAILRAEPGNQAAHSLLGDIYRDQSKAEDAIRWYQMAIDLQPNASDEAKLHKLETEQASLSVRAARRSHAGYADGAVAVPVDGSQAIGTTYLMNMSPRRWLRGITVTSLAFLLVMLIVLVQMQMARRNNDVVPHTAGTDNMATLTSGGNSGDPLPPARFGGGPTLPAGERPNGGAAPSAPGGSGLPPDLHSAGAMTGPVPPGAVTETSKPAPTPPQNLPAAAVNRVRPLEGNPGSALTIPATSNALTGGMAMGAIHDESNDGSANVTVLAQDVNGPGMRDHAIRNVIRAARTAFGNNSKLTRALVTIQTGPKSGEPQILLSAEVERSAVAQADLDNEPVDSLERRIHIR